MIAGGLVAVAVVVAVVLVLTGGDDEKIVAPETTPVSTVLATIPELTIPPEDTLVITLPVITEPGGTKPSVTDPASTDPTATEPVVQTTILSDGEVTDDLGVFAVVLPDGLAVDSTPISTQDNFTLASVAGAVDLEGFYNDDVTPGITVIVVGGEVDSTPADVLAFLEPEAGICKAREEKADFVTTLGSSILLTLRGCGPDGSAAKVILVAAIEGTTSIVATYVQGPGIAADLLPQAQAVFESVRLL